MTDCPDARRRRFDDVVSTVYVPLQRYLLRRTDVTTAEDVLGDVLLVMWRRVDDMPVESTLAWCYAVARRCLANALRAAERRSRLVSRLSERPAPLDDSADLDLSEALGALGETDREVLRLWAWEQLAAREIASVLDITPNAASIRLHRATGRLRNELVRRKNTGAGGQLQGHHGRETGR